MFGYGVTIRPAIARISSGSSERKNAECGADGAAALRHLAAEDLAPPDEA